MEAQFFHFPCLWPRRFWKRLTMCEALPCLWCAHGARTKGKELLSNWPSASQNAPATVMGKGKVCDHRYPFHTRHSGSLGLERIDGRDTAIHLPVVQVFCENGIAAKSFGCGHDLRIVVLNAIYPLYLDRSGDKRIVNGKA